MMKRLALLLCVSLAVLFGCDSRSSPTPPLEVPSTLTFPASLATDYDEIREGSSAAMLGKVASGGIYSTDVAAGATLMDAINAFNDIPIAVWSGVEITCDPDTSTYSIPASTGHNAKKMSFGDFDLDGDGSAEGCSGSTCPVDCSSAGVHCDSDMDGNQTCPSNASGTAIKPVCVRVWVDVTGNGTYERVIAMRMDVIPTPLTDNSGNIVRDADGNVVFDNIGNGAYRAIVDGAAESLGGYLIGNIGSTYMFDSTTDSNAQGTEVFIIEDLLVAQGGDVVTSFNAHASAGQATSSWSSTEITKDIKTVFCSDPLYRESGQWTCSAQSSLYISRFMGEDALGENNFWRGSLLDAGSVVLDNQCVDLGTGNAPNGSTAQTYCDRLSVSGEEVSLATASDVRFPDTANFPETPWF